MKIDKVVKQTLFDLSAVLIVSIAFSLFCLSVNFIGRMYTFFHAFTSLPIAEFLIYIIFLWLLGLLLISYRHWREAVKKKEELENIIASINPDVVMAVDKDRKIIMCNTSVKSMFGFEVDEVINQKTNFLYFDRRSVPCNKHEIHNTVENIGFHRGTATGKKKNGEVIHLEIITAKLRKCEGVVLLLRDISEKTRIEEEKNKIKEQLIRAEKMETIGTLAGGVAHDLNNTLGAIVGYPDLLLNTLPAESPLRRPLLAIKQSGERAATIVHDLLTLTRRGVNISKVLNLNDIISGFLEGIEYKKIIEFHPAVKTETKLGTDVLNIIGSPVHLSKILMNLISNAAEAMPDGGNLFISTENKFLDQPVKGYAAVKEGDYVVLTVSDTGIGISQEDIRNIFEPFYTKKIMGRSGTGLGMAVVWGTVKDHDGYIDVDSTDGVGTTFKIYFPATRQEREQEKEQVSVEEYLGNGEKILVVDDAAAQREVAESLLKQLNYKVEKVASGEDAADYMKNNAVDLLVLDMIMDPGIDGLETYKRILQTHPKQKAVIASGFSETDRIKEAQKLGAGEYIKKPYTLEKIGLAVKAELEKKQ